MKLVCSKCGQKVKAPEGSIGKKHLNCPPRKKGSGTSQKIVEFGKKHNSKRPQYRGRPAVKPLPMRVGN